MATICGYVWVSSVVNILSEFIWTFLRFCLNSSHLYWFLSISMRWKTFMFLLLPIWGLHSTKSRKIVSAQNSLSQVRKYAERTLVYNVVIIVVCGFWYKPHTQTIIFRMIKAILLLMYTMLVVITWPTLSFFPLAFLTRY